MTTDKLKEWCDANKLSDCYQGLLEQEIEDPADLIHLNEKELNEVMQELGLKAGKKGKFKRIVAQLADQNKQVIVLCFFFSQMCCPIFQK